MILTGPLLLIVDLVKDIFNCKITEKYIQENKKLIEKFHFHKHSKAMWIGHPVDCLPS